MNESTDLSGFDNSTSSEVKGHVAGEVEALR